VQVVETAALRCVCLQSDCSRLHTTPLCRGAQL
jgi:hypothetical protein